MRLLSQLPVSLCRSPTLRPHFTQSGALAMDFRGEGFKNLFTVYFSQHPRRVARWPKCQWWEWTGLPISKSPSHFWPMAITLYHFHYFVTTGHYFTLYHFHFFSLLAIPFLFATTALHFWLLFHISSTTFQKGSTLTNHRFAWYFRCVTNSQFKLPGGFLSRRLPNRKIAFLRPIYQSAGQYIQTFGNQTLRKCS